MGLDGEIVPGTIRREGKWKDNRRICRCRSIPGATYSLGRCRYARETIDSSGRERAMPTRIKTTPRMDNLRELFGAAFIYKKWRVFWGPELLEGVYRSKLQHWGNGVASHQSVWPAKKRPPGFERPASL